MKIAVVGSGVSGLAATWLLNNYSDHEVHLYEADSRPGGHANTVTFRNGENYPPVDVDTGFIVFNPTTYPNFLRFLHLHPSLASAIQPTDMTFSVSRDGGAFEWAGNTNGLKAFFTSWSKVLDGKMWRLAYDILRFNACARRVLKTTDGNASAEELSIGDYLKREGYSDTFRDDYLIPMTAAIWSTSPDKCALDFPAKTLIRFMHNHHLLQLTGKPSWLTLQGGSKVYVDQILSTLPPSQLHLSTPIKSVSTLHPSPSPSPSSPSSSSSATNQRIQVQLETTTGQTDLFDHVILATHSDEALRIISAGSGGTPQQREREREILGAFGWSRNEAVLHGDDRVMPKNRATWSCWNYLTSSFESSGSEPSNQFVQGCVASQDTVTDKVAVTYWMNALQHIPTSTYGPIFVTLNPFPGMEPTPEKVVARFKYDHPILDSKATQAQARLPEMQGTRGISYAGAYWKYGFHEDGFTSGLRAVLNLDAGLSTSGSGSGSSTSSCQVPFEVVDADSKCARGSESGGGGGVFAEMVFEVMERSGLRRVLGRVLGLGMCFVGWMVELMWAMACMMRTPQVQKEGSVESNGHRETYEE